jgi:hypothetical protein
LPAVCSFQLSVFSFQLFLNVAVARCPLPDVMKLEFQTAELAAPPG